MKYAKRNALLHEQRVLEMQQRKLEEYIQSIRDEQPLMNGVGEAEVVVTALISAVLLDWRRKWDAEYDNNSVTSTSYNQFIGPMTYLVEQTGLPQRAIYRAMHGETKHVSFTHAEKILMAIDREYMLSNGEIPVIPNPRWSMQRWTKYMASRGCTTDDV